MTTVLVTGANRGLGLMHVVHALDAGERLIACCRAPAAAAALLDLQTYYGPEILRLEPLDVTSAESVAGLATRLAGRPIDILINNAGVYGTAPWPQGALSQSLPGMDYALWDRILQVNVIGVFRLLAGLLENLLAGDRKLVVMISSRLGSIAENTQGMSHAYRSSKAALNMLVRGLAVDLRPRDLSVIALAPGWSLTDLGGEHAEWDAPESVAMQRRVIATAGLAQSGQFLNHTGELLPW